LTGEHPDIGPELQQLAAKILAMLTPLMQAAAAAPSTGGELGKCQQVWCPLCAMAAVASGEQHPLIALVAEHSASLLALIRATVGPPAAGTPSADAQPGDLGKPSPAPSRYEHIDVTIVD
jgi:hypothetical protein